MKKKQRIQVKKQCKNCENVFYVERVIEDKPRKKERSCCSIYCARSLSSKEKREEINKKVSKTIKAYYDKIGRKGKEKKLKLYKCKTCSTPINKNVYGYCQSCYRKTPIFSALVRAALKNVLKKEDIKVGHQEQKQVMLKSFL